MLLDLSLLITLVGLGRSLAKFVTYTPTSWTVL
jgi:hypothetical protein